MLDKLPIQSLDFQLPLDMPPRTRGVFYSPCTPSFKLAYTPWVVGPTAVRLQPSSRFAMLFQYCKTPRRQCHAAQFPQNPSRHDIQMVVRSAPMPTERSMSTAQQPGQKRHVQLKDCCSAVSLHGSMHGSVTAIAGQDHPVRPSGHQSEASGRARRQRAPCTRSDLQEHHATIAASLVGTTTQVIGLCRWHFRL